MVTFVSKLQPKSLIIFGWYLVNRTLTDRYSTQINDETKKTLLRPRSHDTGMKLCRLKIITFSTIHTVPVELYLFQLFFISLLKFAR